MVDCDYRSKLHRIRMLRRIIDEVGRSLLIGINQSKLPQATLMETTVAVSNSSGVVSENILQINEDHQHED